MIGTQRSRYLVTVLLLLGTFAAWRATAHSPEPLAAPLETIDRQIKGWETVAELPLQKEVLQVLAPTSYLSREYQRNGRKLGLLIVYYDNQHAGDSLHSPRNCLPGSGWDIWSYDTADVPVEGRAVAINKYGVQNGSFRMQVLYWYQSRRHIFASEYLGKVLLMRDSLVDRTTSGSLVRITLSDTPADLQAGLQFASILVPQLQHSLGR